MQPITVSDLPYAGNPYEPEGTHDDGAPASLILFNGPPGSGDLHSMDIHLSEHFITEWLEGASANH